MAGVRSRHVVVTLAGTAEALPGGLGRLRWLSLQPGAANANPVFVGGDNVTTVSYGTRLPPAAAGVPPAPHVIAEFEDGSMAPEEIFVIGTASEKLHVHMLVYV